MKAKKLILSIFLTAILAILFSNKASALTQYPELDGHYFYIKNAYTGQYLDVDGGVAQGGTNVQQYQFKLNQNRQLWYTEHLGNGEYAIYTKVGCNTSGDVIYLNYALDVDNGINANGTQIHIWNGVGGGLTQTYSFTRNSDSTYIIWTKASNYTKVVSLSNNVCSNGVNIHQWEYSNHCHDHWIMEPVYQNETMGVRYATSNYNNCLECYPDFHGFGGDCTNFVSQCLLASGGRWHQHDTWYCRRLNTTYHYINSANELDYSWSFEDPSPWISADEFKQGFDTDDIFEGSYRTVNCQTILNNPSQLIKSPYYVGDVAQIVHNVLGLGICGVARHTMYITDYDVQNISGSNYSTYVVTYHSTDTQYNSLFNVMMSSDFNTEILRMYNCVDN